MDEGRWTQMNIGKIGASFHSENLFMGMASKLSKVPKLLNLKNVS